MDKVIVDSNILFSAILNLDSNIGQILINGSEYYDFYSPKYVRTELLKHKSKIRKITKLSEDEFFETYELILKNVTILNHSILPENDFKKASEYCRDIDIDDTIFVGFSEYLEAKLWTGDKRLIEGLEKKGFKRTITTRKLVNDFIEKNKKRE